MSLIESEVLAKSFDKKQNDSQRVSLINLPTDLLLAILKCRYKNKRQMYIKQSTIQKQTCDSINQEQQIELANINTNQLLVWTDCMLASNKQKALRKIGKYLKQMDQHIKQTQSYILQYLVAYLNVECMRNSEIIMQVKTYVPNLFWYELVYKLIKNSIQQQNSKLQMLILQQFISNVEVTCREYVEQSCTLLFSIFKQVLQLAATYKPQAVQNIRILYIKQYLSVLPTFSQANNKKQTNNARVFELLKIIQLLHIADSTFAISELAKSKQFMTHHLYTCLCDFGTKGANALAINIYGAIMKQLQLFDDSMQVFVDIYLTLDCYGMHLVKDIWDRFYTLCNNADKQANPSAGIYHTFPISDLLHIILSKVEQHTNHNVPKYCIQSLLAATPAHTTPIFQHLQDTVYGSLIQILNTGTHYNDITHFHQDSKIYTLTRSFYLGYYRKLAQGNNAEKLKQHLQKLLHAMNKYITFQHCIIAYIGIFAQIPDIKDHQGKSMKLLAKQEVDILVQLTNRFLIKLTFRKRHKLLQSVLTCMKANVDWQQIGLQYAIQQIIMKMPKQLIDICSIQNGRSIPNCYSLILDNFSNQLKALSQKQKQKDRNKYTQLIGCKYLLQHPQQYKQQLQQYQKIRKQQSILQIIIGWKDNQHSNQLINQTIINDLQILATSSYCHPLLHSITLYTISILANYSSLQIMANIIKSNVQLSNNLLLVLTNNSNNKLVHIKYVLNCLQIVAAAINQSNNEQNCKNYAKFIQYCIININDNNNDNIKYKQQQQQQEQQQQSRYKYFLTLLVHAIKYKQQYTIRYIAIQDSLYTLFPKVKQLKYAQAKHKLRLQLLLFTILAHDFQFAYQLLTTTKIEFVEEIGQFCNLYDYQHYDEVFYFYAAVAKTLNKAYCKNTLTQQKWVQFASTICKHVEQALKTMLHNLDYGVHRKQVVSSTQCIIKISIILNLTDQAVKLINFVLEVGEKYWGFQRHTIFTMLYELNQINYEYRKYENGLLKLIPTFAIIEQYRGEDSAILLPQHSRLPVYKFSMLHKQADYDGTAIRFAVLQWVQNQLNHILQQSEHQLKEEKSKANIQFWLKLFDNCFHVCMTENSRERMFLTGTHKTKIKLRQFLMLYPNFLLAFSGKQKYKQIVLRCLSSTSQNNLQQIKHYCQTFMMKLIYLNPTPYILQQACTILMNQLLTIEGQSSLLKNVSYMMIGGLILQLFYHKGLYSVLFSSVCSHIAYYRGLSQYFCYQSIDNAKNSELSDVKYMLILYKEYLKDEDALKLTKKLEGIVEGYKKLVNDWNVQHYLFNQKPTLNGQVVSQDHHIDKLKYLGHELVKQHKHEDGFMPYKQIWKKIVNESQQFKQQKQQLKQAQNSFQRKIDPSLDDLYNFQPVQNKEKTINQLKILVLSAEQIAFYGHMARVGQILGISELCIPHKRIIDMEDFYNVSVTAEKWLNITQHGFDRVQKKKQIKKQKVIKKNNKNSKPLNKANKKNQQQKAQFQEEYEQICKQNIFKIITKLKSDGYTLYLVRKSAANLALNIQKLEIKKKSLLIIDELSLLDSQLEQIVDQFVSFNSYFSYHVEATIFIWEYFKKFSIVK